MKKALLFSIILAFFLSLTAIAYETIIIDFPPKSKWDVIYYKKIDTEAILQYIPHGQDKDNWKQSIIVHSYKEYNYGIRKFTDFIVAELIRQNPTAGYKFFRYSDIDSVAVRSTSNYKNIKGHCEILRATKAAEGSITIQYIDRDKEHFHKNYNTWLKIIRDARLYNSYWRDDRFMNKGESFEL